MILPAGGAAALIVATGGAGGTITRSDDEPTDGMELERCHLHLPFETTPRLEAGRPVHLAAAATLFSVFE